MSISQSEIKRLNALQRKKVRYERNAYIAEGEKMILEHLRSKPKNIQQLFALEEWLEEYEGLIGQLSYDKINEVTERELKKISNLSTPNKVLAEVKMPDHALEKQEFESNFSIYLDGIRNPGNMGTIIRIADWFGFPYVLCSHDCVDVYNPKVVQATMGSLIRVKLINKELHEVKEEYNIHTYGAMLDGENAASAAFVKPGLLVIGSEADGIRPENYSSIDTIISIPGVGNSAESLNAGIATGILAFMAFNQE